MYSSTFLTYRNIWLINKNHLLYFVTIFVLKCHLECVNMPVFSFLCTCSTQQFNPILVIFGHLGVPKQLWDWCQHNFFMSAMMSLIKLFNYSMTYIVTVCRNSTTVNSVTFYRFPSSQLFLYLSFQESNLLRSFHRQFFLHTLLYCRSTTRFDLPKPVTVVILQYFVLVFLVLL